MSSFATAQALYALVSSTAQTQRVPEGSELRPHHNSNGKGFHNPWDSFMDRSGPTILWGMIKRRFSGKGNSPDTTPPTVPVRQPEFLPTRETPHLRATWLGHACYLVEFPSGLRVLFDPVFTPRCSPFSWLGPKRYTEQPCNIADIPIVDLVVISHNHYDHLSLPTIRQIQQKHPKAHFFAPLGNKKWFSDSGIREEMTELDWWKSSDMSLSPSPGGGPDEIDVSEAGSQTGAANISATVNCLPCQHMTARTPFDRCETLWSSWSIESGGKKVYFAGDTGYRSVPESSDGEDDYSDRYQELPRCPAFRQIGDLRGPFDLGLIPIGAYQPRWIMSPMHANPFDSVNIFKETRCDRALGMHWGTWVLTEEDVLEPPVLLKEALKQSGKPEEGVFDICDIGESREFGDLPRVQVEDLKK